jgi:flagellar protein FliJ
MSRRLAGVSSRVGVLKERAGMKSRDTLIRLKRFQLEEKRRRVRQIELMVAEFARISAELDREISSEEKRAGITDPRHFAYPTYARAASARRDNLKSSIAELATQLEEAKAAHDEAQAELVKVEALESRDKANDRSIDVAVRA